MKAVTEKTTGSVPCVTIRAIAVCALVLFSQGALAAGGFGTEAKNALTDIQKGIYGIVAVVATIALVWQMALGFMEKKQWPDVLGTCLWIIGSGAGIAGATWLFDIGGKMSFS